MKYFKSVCAGALATALMLAPGCESRPTHPQVDPQQGTGGAGMIERGDQGLPRTGASDDSMNRGSTEDLDRGTGGSGSSTGVGGTGTGDVQGDSSQQGLGTGSTDSNQVGGSTGTGTEGSDMGSGGATNSAQDQGTPPR